MDEPAKRDGENDPIHQQLRKAVEKRERSYLWVPSDEIIFIPRVLPTIYGDGRALYALTTINQRPRYWIIRCCSSWGSDIDDKGSTGMEFGGMTDDILTELEGAFGNGRCGYSGNSLFWPKRDRLKNCQCEECTDGPMARWPMVDGTVGCSWSRMDWPKRFATEPNPFSWKGNLLSVKGAGA